MDYNEYARTKRYSRSYSHNRNSFTNILADRKIEWNLQINMEWGHVDLSNMRWWGDVLVKKKQQQQGFQCSLVAWSLWLDFETKMPISHDGTWPRDVLQGLVAGTSPSVNVFRT